MSNTDVVVLERFQLEGVLGSGSDYEVHAATDSQTGKRVVIKRPNPDYITRKMHHGVDQLSEQLVEVHRTIGDSVPYVCPMVGYTEVARHDDYFGDSLNESYRVLIEERAKGLPLVSDIRDKFKGIPIGLSQNLFALHPLVPHPEVGHFAIHQQLMDVEEAFNKAGHLVLDMRPQNIYFDPKQARIAVIDIGTIPTQGPAAQGKASMGNQPKDVHDFFLEVFRFYASPVRPPHDVGGYREPAGMRNIPHFNQQIEIMIQSFSGIEDAGLKEAAVTTLEKLQKRSYASFDNFRDDFNQYLTALEERNQNLSDRHLPISAWGQAMEMLSDEYWMNFLFDAEADLAPYRTR